MAEEYEVESVVGAEDPFIPGAAAAAHGAPRGANQFTRSAPGANAGWGRGPVQVDRRRYRFDMNAAVVRPPVSFNASKVDRMDPTDAGDLLHSIHTMFGIETQAEERLLAFNRALWYEHAVNGGSTLQAARGHLFVDGVSFDIPLIIQKLGVEARRFFRAYADDIADTLKFVLAQYDPYDPESAEKHGAIMQVAVERGLQKYPYMCHDSSDAGVNWSIEERVALISSKRYVIASVTNKADSFAGRVGDTGTMGVPGSLQAV